MYELAKQLACLTHFSQKCQLMWKKYDRATNNTMSHMKEVFQHDRWDITNKFITILNIWNQVKQ